MRQLVGTVEKSCKTLKLKKGSNSKKKRKTIVRVPLKRATGLGCSPRVFGIDVLKCECGGELKPVSAILKGDEVKRYLRHLGLDPDPPDIEIEEASEQVGLFLGDSYKEEVFEMAPEEFPVINHD